jgi:hypothetical protein
MLGLNIDRMCEFLYIICKQTIFFKEFTIKAKKPLTRERFGAIIRVQQHMDV